MLGTIYKALSGMQGFSKGLDLIGNNIANLNTPGYKGESASFRDLFYRYASAEGGSAGALVGQGVDASSTRTNFGQGSFQSTNNPLDIAIDGYGFLILRDGMDFYYTRAGQVRIDEEGYLVELNSGFRVQALQGSNSLVDININALDVSPPAATRNIVLTDNLTRNLGVSGTAAYQIDNITVYDSNGIEHTLQLQFSSNVAGTWTVNVYEPSVSTTVSIGTGQIQYAGDGTPMATQNTVTFTLAPASTPPSSIVLNFGDAGTYTGTTSFTSASSAAVLSQDGYAAGAMTDMTFAADGTLSLSFSNGQTSDGPRIGLAWFQDLQALVQEGQSLFINKTNQQIILNYPNEGAMGEVVPGKYELANVELTEQFTEMIIIQRGYQASSQIASVTNEMIQQLLDIQKR